MHFRDIPTVVEALVTRVDLSDDIKYESEIVRNMDGGKHYNFITIPLQSYYNHILISMKGRIYSEITNSNNFRRIEARIPAGNTLLYVILAIDDTCLSSHSGNAKARPLYITLGNFSNASRRKLNRHAWMLAALLPMPEEANKFTPDEKTQFHHNSLAIVLDTLAVAEQTGMNIHCSDGIDRRCTPVPSQCVVDLLEAWTMAGIPNKCCPQCIVEKESMNDLYSPVIRRNSERFKYVLEEALSTSNTDAVKYYCSRYKVSPIFVRSSSCSLIQYNQILT